MTKLALIVETAERVADGVQEVVLRAADGAPLPSFTPGAHLRVDLPDGRTNAYSLIDAEGAGNAPLRYVLVIRLDPAGQGGSRHMHALKAGDPLAVNVPRNDFPLREHAGRAILVAGGIGITPILSMAAALHGTGRPYRLHYAARNHAAAAYAEALAERHGEALSLHLDDEAGGPLDVATVLADARPDDHVYVCGPRPMIDAVRGGAEARGLGPDQIHSELFDAPAPSADDAAFEVEIASTGQIVQVPADRSIIDALEDAGIDVMYDCQRGDCGICQTTVLEGVPDHRDVVLSEAERAAGDVMQICVSRALTPRLKLDL